MMNKDLWEKIEKFNFDHSQIAVVEPHLYSIHFVVEVLVVVAVEINF